MPTPTPTEQAIMKERLHAARSALRFFKVRPIASGEGVFNPSWLMCLQRTRQRRQDVIDTYRDFTTSRAMSFHAAASTGLGNCEEKGAILYLSLHGNPVLLRQANCRVTFCSAMGYVHGFVTITDHPVPCYVPIQSLGVTALIVDGWTEDAYFPNSSMPMEFNIANISQRRVRQLLRSQDIRPMDKVSLPDGPLQDINDTPRF